jgi:hypothetical protein
MGVLCGNVAFVEINEDGLRGNNIFPAGMAVASRGCWDEVAGEVFPRGRFGGGQDFLGKVLVRRQKGQAGEILIAPPRVALFRKNPNGDRSFEVREDLIGEDRDRGRVRVNRRGLGCGGLNHRALRDRRGARCQNTATPPRRGRVARPRHVKRRHRDSDFPRASSTIIRRA